jgi:hypothetical protein
MPPDEFTDIGSMRALLADARERIKEAEDRGKDSLDRVEERIHGKIEEFERQLISINLELSKWIPLLTNLQKADENKRNLTLLLVVSFITNVATIVMSVFIWFVKSGSIK